MNLTARYKKIIRILLIALPGQLLSQTTSSEILLKLQKLNTTGSVLYIAAHPDDENTRLLGYLSNELNVRTAYLSITRGDGGQNLIGKEQGELLGLVRTQELLAARRTDGAEQFFTRANDFGYSKNPEETLKFWNKDSVLSDMVFVIRKFRPDIIICRFPTTGEGGHGHHTASALLAAEAFEAASDPSKFASQLKTVSVWKPRRLLWNTFNFGGNNTTSPDQLKVDVGIYNALIGKSYGEIAAESRSMHKSQGFGSAKQRGSNLEYFKILKGDSIKKDLFEGLNVQWDRMRGTETVKELIETCIRNYDVNAPEKSINSLISIYRALENLNESDESVKYWKLFKLNETKEILLQCAGLWLECNAKEYMAIPGDEIQINSQIVVRNKTNVKLKSIHVSNSIDTLLDLNLKQNEFYSFKHIKKVSPSQAYSTPYWLTHKHSLGMYTVNDRTLIGQAENKAAFQINYVLSIQDLELSVSRDVVFKQTDPVKGEVYRPVEVLPPVTITIPEKVYIFTNGQTRTIQISVKANKNNIQGTLNLSVKNDFEVKVNDREIQLANKGDEKQIDIEITPGRKSKSGLLELSIQIGNETFNKSIKRIEYDHIPYQFTLEEAEINLQHIDLKLADSTIAYIPGAGDNVAECLKQIGYRVNIVTVDQLAKENLKGFSAIVVGIRAFNTHTELSVHHSKLMEYVKNGGNLIVQYNTNSRVGPLQTNIGPYPFTISRNRVTEEDAKVNFVHAKHSVLNYPHQISKSDFEDWIQERGIYFAEELDKNYETILSMADKGEKAHEGSLIVAKYGMGNFVYTGLSFFRELPAGVSGSYRLFVNLLSLPKNK